MARDFRTPTNAGGSGELSENYARITTASGENESRDAARLGRMSVVDQN